MVCAGKNLDEVNAEMAQQKSGNSEYSLINSVHHPNNHGAAIAEPRGNSVHGGALSSDRAVELMQVKVVHSVLHQKTKKGSTNS